MKTVLYLILCFPVSVSNQLNLIFDNYTIENIYHKIEVDDGVLDEDGDEIDYIFIPTELDNGIYDIEITDGPGNLYEIKGTDYYVEFRSYFGYAGYGQEGILEIKGGYYNNTFYKRE